MLCGNEYHHLPLMLLAVNIIIQMSLIAITRWCLVCLHILLSCNENAPHHLDLCIYLKIYQHIYEGSRATRSQPESIYTFIVQQPPLRGFCAFSCEEILTINKTQTSSVDLSNMVNGLNELPRDMHKELRAM